MILRSATHADLPALLQLSESIPGGMTSMPFDQSTWEKKLALVESSFSSRETKMHEAIYFFVLEDPDIQEIVGTCGMHAGVGLNRPFYNYKLSRHVSKSKELDITVNSNTLNLCNDFTGETELVSLFLKESHRKAKVGQFLSRSRFMFLREFESLFGNVVFAEIRGWLNSEGESPFWDSLGRQFFDMPYFKADFISAVNGSQFISDLMPRFPVYLELLSQEAVAVIGKPNKDSLAAMRLLEKEGFQYQRVVDIFDAGPVVQSYKDRIKSVLQTQDYRVVDSFSGADEAYNCMVSNKQFGSFKAVLAQVERLDENSIVLSEKALQMLEVELQSEVSVLPLRD